MTGGGGGGGGRGREREREGEGEGERGGGGGGVDEGEKMLKYNVCTEWLNAGIYIVHVQ